MSKGAKWEWLCFFIFLIMKEARIKSCFHNENGASVLFVVISLPIMFTLIVLTINIGQMIFDRIRLQTTVDACALAGATRQSIGLNEIADLNLSAEIEFGNAKKNLEGKSWSGDSSALQGYNEQLSGFNKVIDTLDKRIKKEPKPAIRELLELQKKYFEKMTDAMGMLSAGLPWHNESFFDMAYQQHKWALDTINTLRKRANRKFAADAWDYAKSVQMRSLPGARLFSVAQNVAGNELMRFRQEEKSVRGRWWTTTCKGTDCIPIWGAGWYVPSMPRPACGTVLPAKKATTVRTMPTLRRPPIRSKTERLKVRWEKNESVVTFVAYGLTQKRRLLLGEKLLDLRRTSLFSKLPASYRGYLRNYLRKVDLSTPMTAYAAAKPTGGNVYGKEAQYRPIMVQLNRVPTTIFDSRMEH